ncbi:GNAT family N-acetyltransferase [Sulfitobacter sp. SK012]|uniref:GNAT family N-acetyltransferase n=1 Tax=Sulfitobacter sp. SK012 TaxID=1389005 RepID=UPI001C1FC0CC|nr:GNAT family N-acetyltransferase [Sulfitobacter sp. SK012]
MATQFSPRKLEKIAAIFGTKSAREGLSSVAVESVSGEIVGAVLTHDFGRAPPSEIEDVDLSSEPVIALLDELEEIFANAHEIGPGEFLHIFMIAVRDDFSGKGIAQNLVQSCLEQAKNLGYGLAFTEATNQISQRVFKNVGFDELHLIGYSTFEFHGRKPFQGISQHRGCALMEMDLSTYPDRSLTTG